LKPSVEAAIGLVRTTSLKLKVRSPQDSLAMTVGNMLPLMAAERGIEGVRRACYQILDNCHGTSPDKVRLRACVDRLLQLI
jgi:hypothetical protein